MPIVSNWNRVRGLLYTYMKIKELMPISQITFRVTGIVLIKSRLLCNTLRYVTWRVLKLSALKNSHQNTPVRICACMEESFAYARVWRTLLQYMCVYGWEFWRYGSERKLIIEKEVQEGGKSEPEKDLPRSCSAPHSLGESCVFFQGWLPPLNISIPHLGPVWIQ